MGHGKGKSCSSPETLTTTVELLELETEELSELAEDGEYWRPPEWT